MRKLHKTFLKYHTIRILIVLAWGSIIFGMLFVPGIKWLNRTSRSINIFTWGDILEPSVIEAFERETGIKVHLNYYTSNEELLVKMRATRGVGYDLIVPSDYGVQLLIEENLLKPIDKSKLTFWEAINPLLCNHYFDPSNTYSIPFEWEIYGLGIDTEYFKDRKITPSWKMVFNKEQIDYPLVMADDPIMASLMAGLYLHNNVSSYNETEFAEIRKLLIEQKAWVKAYSDFRADYYLLTRNSPLILALSSYIWRAMKHYPFIDFQIPEEGSFISIESLAMPKETQKEELVYQLINYLYRPASVKAHWDTFGFFPATIHTTGDLDLDPKAAQLINSSKKEFEKFHLTQFPFPKEKMRSIWIDVKAK